jgi:hypothetical protein
LEQNCVFVDLLVEGEHVNYRITKQLDLFVFEPLFKLHQRVKPPFFSIQFLEGDFTCTEGLDQDIVQQGLQVLHKYFKAPLPLTK